MLVTAVILLMMSVGAIILIVIGLPGPRLGRIDTCPKCSYDLKGRMDGEQCPECGYNWKENSGLMHQPMRRGRVAIGASVLIIVVLSTYWFSLLDSDDWSTDMPRFMLHPLAKLLTEPIIVPPGKVLPHPDETLYGTRSHWDATLWRTQASESFESLLRLVEGAQTDLASLENLAVAMQEGHELYVRHGGLMHSSFDPIDNWRSKQLDRMIALDAQHALPLGDWMRSEIQFLSYLAMPALDGRSDIVLPPLDVHVRLMESTDPTIRRYAFDRLSWAWKGGNDAAMPLLEQCAQAEQDAAVKAHFEGVVAFFRSMIQQENR